MYIMKNTQDSSPIPAVCSPLSMVRPVDLCDCIHRHFAFSYRTIPCGFGKFRQRWQKQRTLKRNFGGAQRMRG